MSKALEKTVQNIETKLTEIENVREETEREIELKTAQIKSMKATLAGLKRLQGKLS